MSTDRVVSFTGKPPTTADLFTVLADYLGSAATRVWPDRSSIYATLPGAYSQPFQRLDDTIARQMASGCFNRDRGLEVFVGDGYVSVITRMQDEFVNAVADGLAAVIARYWQGIRE